MDGLTRVVYGYCVGDDWSEPDEHETDSTAVGHQLTTRHSNQSKAVQLYDVLKNHSQKRQTDTPGKFNSCISPLLRFRRPEQSFVGIEYGSKSSQKTQNCSVESCDTTTQQLDLDIAETLTIIHVAHVDVRPYDDIDDTDEVHQHDPEDHKDRCCIAVAKMPYQRWEVEDQE